MSTLKNSLELYNKGYNGIAEFFYVTKDLGFIKDLTSFKWYKEDDDKVIYKDKYGYKTITYCAGEIFEHPYYTLVITQNVSYVLDNKLKSDSVTLYLENGK